MFVPFYNCAFFLLLLYHHHPSAKTMNEQKKKKKLYIIQTSLCGSIKVLIFELNLKIHT